MIRDIKGLHHISSMSADAAATDRFFTGVLGLRRVKKTVNFDSPDVYHLYYGDQTGTPGSVMTYFPFGRMPRGRRGTGEVGITEFAVPHGALPYWQTRLSDAGVTGLHPESFLGEARLCFDGPDGDGFALVETDPQGRSPWTGTEIPPETAILGFHGARIRLRDSGAMTELLGFMGYERTESTGALTRYRIFGGNAADTLDIETLPDSRRAGAGAGSVHHIAFSVGSRAEQLAVRKALMDTGYDVTPVVDRDYFWAIYFRTPGGVLFEVATDEPGFDRDEDPAVLGRELKLPDRYEPMRAEIEGRLPRLDP